MDEPHRNNASDEDSPLAWTREGTAGDKVDLARRLEFLGLTPDDAARLQSLVPIFDRMADEFVERFYRHLFAFDETSRFLRDPRLVERLKLAQLTSHDLKTPLATMANLCDEVLDEFGDTVPQSAREMIDAARRQTFRMSSLIDEILASTIAPQSTEANELVASGEVLVDALDRVRHQLDKSQIEVVRPRDFPDVWGNPVRLREAFFNVLSNAAKFIERRPGRIEIQVEIDDNFATFWQNRGGQAHFSRAPRRNRGRVQPQASSQGRKMSQSPNRERLQAGSDPPMIAVKKWSDHAIPVSIRSNRDRVSFVTCSTSFHRDSASG